MQQIINALQKAEDLRLQEERMVLISNNVYKRHAPFSLRLNKWLEDWINAKEDIFNFTSKDDFDPEDIEGTFKRHLEKFKSTGGISIWNGASENTIYGDPEINLVARAWHDLTHLENNLGYSALEEIQVAQIQMSQLPADWYFEKLLVNAEVTGQVLYHLKYGKFPENQRQFTLNFLQNGCS